MRTPIGLLVLSILSVAGACTRHAVPPSEPQPIEEQVIGLQYRTEDPVSFSIAAVLFVVAHDLKGRLSIKMVHGQGEAVSKFCVNLNEVKEVESFVGPGTALWVDGNRIRVDQGVLKLGDKAYGSAGPGSKVRIEARGVFVDDVPRGEL